MLPYIIAHIGVSKIEPPQFGYAFFCVQKTRRKLKMENQFGKRVAGVHPKQEGDKRYGYIVWYTVKEKLYHRGFVLDLFKHAEIQVDHYPKLVRPVDAYRRAASDVSNEVIGATETITYYFRESNKDSSKIVHSLLKDTEGPERESYSTKVGEIVFDRKREVIESCVV